MRGYIFRLYPIDKQKELIKENNRLKEVSIRGYRKLKEIKGRIINSTVYKEVGKYYISICVEELVNIPTPIPTKIIGIDLGIKDIVITNDGETLENKYIIEKYEKKLKGLNRWLARIK